KAREIYDELGPGSALSYIKSSYHLLSKIYHPDLNPGNEEKAVILQQRLNNISKLISQTSNREIIGILRKSSPEEPKPKKKILLVEDEPHLRKIFHNLFLMEGYDVRVAIDGEDGYHNFLAFNPDLVFTDVVMPKMSGMELVRNIRRHNPSIKVIYISGFFGLRNIKRDLNKDLLKYNYLFLSKPFRISTMLDLVHKYLTDPVKVDVQA
ncbi:MAG: response regulator, partial [Smithellaceae bacterium]